MKFNFLFLILVFFGCKKEYPEPDDKQLIGGISSFCFETKYISHSGNELFIDMDIAVFVGGYGDDLLSINDSAFKDYSIPNHSIYVDSIESVTLNEAETYSNLILLDQSEGWNDYDLFNAKTRSLNKAILDGKENPLNEIALGSFARNGYFTNSSSIWVFEDGNPFTQTSEELGKILYDKFWEYGGTSNIYDALFDMIDHCTNFSTLENKYITVITHGYPDNENSYTADEIIAKAKANNIKINIMMLADNDDGEMAKLAGGTGGFIQMITNTPSKELFVSDIVDEGAPVMASMHRILAKDIHVYKVHLRLVKTSGNWQPGATLYNYYQTLERYTDGTIRINNYMPYYVEIP